MKTSRLLAVFLLAAAPLAAQQHVPSKVEIAWNRYYDLDEIQAHMRAIAAAYPDLVRLETIGTTLQGRDMLLAIVRGGAAGTNEADRPAMWIDGNVHGNEIQAAEAVLYTLWYLTKSYGANEELTALLDRASFYLLPSQNPDGRAYWFAAPNTPSSSRDNQRPVDDDRDGLVDEDGPDDLDGDGSITTMWKQDPDGDWTRDRDDPRIFRRVDRDEGADKPKAKGEWRRLGSEGIDNDGDGDINEDGPGGDDMNRNWPTDWQPEHVQFAAGPFPLSHPETRAIADFLLAHPNVAAVQSYHNTGGMILRGPGASYREDLYPEDDRAVYAELGRVGEQLLPWYRYMILFKDLYTVHGGFVNWTAEGLGIFSFTNEMWSFEKYFQRPGDGGGGGFGGDRSYVFQDLLQFGDVFQDFTEVEHPTHGRILVGGTNKWASRSTPTFMLEEECHRNFGFTMFHASQMPRLAFERVAVAPLGDGLWSVTVAIENDRLIPTRSGIARARKIGAPDVLTCSTSAGEVVAAGTLERFDDRQFEPVLHEPARLVVAGGIRGHAQEDFRFVIAAPAGTEVTLRYAAEKAVDLETTVTLE